MGDRVAVLKGGHLQQVDTPQALYSRPANAFVATFIGSPAMNLVPGRRTEGGLALAGGATLAAVPEAVPNECVIGVRPEHLEVVPADAPGAWPVALEVVEFAGADTMLSCRLGDNQLLAMVHDRVSARPGAAIGLRPRPDHVHWFDAGHGQRIA